VGGGTIKSFSEIAQVLLGVKAVNDLGSIRKLIVGDVPNPNGSVPEHDPAWRLAEAAARGLPPDALGKGRTFGGGIQCRSTF